MSAPRSRRNGFLLPLALTATAAAASLALYYFLHDDSTTDPPRHAHESGDELSRRSTTRGASRRSPPATASEHKKAIALVVRESSVGTVSNLLSHLPTPLPLDRANIFVLIFSPNIVAHPLSDSDGAEREAEGKVYRQARKLFPREAPRELVMPYTDEQSLVPMLKQLAPEGVYIESSLVGGDDADVIMSVLDRGWVGAVVAAVEDPERGQKIADATARFGRRVRVLDVARVGDDWLERVG